MKLSEITREKILAEALTIDTGGLASTEYIKYIVSEIEKIVLSDESVKELIHFKDSSTGLYCIDKNPAFVTKEWIEENNFQL